jgi:hypothetical protein
MPSMTEVVCDLGEAGRSGMFSTVSSMSLSSWSSIFWWSLVAVEVACAWPPLPADEIPESMDTVCGLCTPGWDGECPDGDFLLTVAYNEPSSGPGV